MKSIMICADLNIRKRFKIFKVKFHSTVLEDVRDPHIRELVNNIEGMELEKIYIGSILTLD